MTTEPITTASTDARRDLVVVAFAWGCVVASTIVLGWRYSELPDVLPLYRIPTSDAPVLGPKTPFTVGRIAAMGVGQIGATTVMAWASRACRGWRPFWIGATVAAGVKMFFVGL